MTHIKQEIILGYREEEEEKETFCETIMINIVFYSFLSFYLLYEFFAYLVKRK